MMDTTLNPVSRLYLILLRLLLIIVLHSRHDIAEILLKLALNTKQPINQSLYLQENGTYQYL
jgi:hypothetical protein